ERPGALADRREIDVDREFRPVPPDCEEHPASSHGALARRQEEAREVIRVCRPQPGRYEASDGQAPELVPPVSEETLCLGVRPLDPPVGRDREDRLRRGVEEAAENRFVLTPEACFRRPLLYREAEGTGNACDHARHVRVLVGGGIREEREHGGNVIAGHDRNCERDLHPRRPHDLVAAEARGGAHLPAPTRAPPAPPPPHPPPP